MLWGIAKALLVICSSWALQGRRDTVLVSIPKVTKKLELLSVAEWMNDTERKEHEKAGQLRSDPVLGWHPGTRSLVFVPCVPHEAILWWPGRLTCGVPLHRPECCCGVWPESVLLPRCVSLRQNWTWSMCCVDRSCQVVWEACVQVWGCFSNKSFFRACWRSYWMDSDAKCKCT